MDVLEPDLPRSWVPFHSLPNSLNTDSILLKKACCGNIIIFEMMALPKKNAISCMQYCSCGIIIIYTIRSLGNQRTVVFFRLQFVFCPVSSFQHQKYIFCTPRAFSSFFDILKTGSSFRDRDLMFPSVRSSNSKFQSAEKDAATHNVILRLVDILTPANEF